MSLTELWKTSREQLINKQVQQIIAFAGEGKLRDGNITSQEFREFLSHIPSDILKVREKLLLDRKQGLGKANLSKYKI